MKKKSKLTIIFFLFLFSIDCVDACHYKTLYVVNIDNNQILQIVDSLIACRQRCKVYKPESLYINMYKDKLSTNYIFEINYVNNINMIDENDKCFIYKGHLVIIDSIIQDNFFSITNKKKKIIFHPNVEPSIDEPDTYVYSFQDGIFILVLKFCRCD